MIKLQIVTDKKGAALFPPETELKYDSESKTFYDSECRYRGDETVIDLAESLGLIEMGKDWKHQKRTIAITLEEAAEKEGGGVKNLNLVSLDLECNQPSGSIIQVGYVIGNISDEKISERICRNVRIEEKINPRITELTGIKQEDVDAGASLKNVYDEMCGLHEKYKCFRNPLTWGGGDSLELRTALGLDDEKFLFGRRWIDAKTLFISYCIANDLKIQSGLAKSLTRLGINFEGRKHNALDDAYNTFRIYKKLLEKIRA